ncbi:hypothetical protein JTE90_023825 [Oedothorax gibbosus]|uniref:Uncharacterized protein n=1 Tax=Oedothorax gibbosus TaxID=931172 RepID=A0AAV6VIH1_9ARAC|nr:hypothetical protein JTE90_023825 [Oedothorax gibbosus]
MDRLSLTLTKYLSNSESLVFILHEPREWNECHITTYPVPSNPDQGMTNDLVTIDHPSVEILGDSPCSPVYLRPHMAVPSLLGGLHSDFTGMTNFGNSVTC